MTTTLRNKSVKIQVATAISALIGVIVFTSQFTSQMNDLEYKANEGTKALMKYKEIDEKVTALEKRSDIIAIRVEYLTKEHAE